MGPHPIIKLFMIPNAIEWVFALLILFQVKHFLADFVFQNVYMLRKGSPNWDFVVQQRYHIEATLFRVMNQKLAKAFNPEHCRAEAYYGAEMGGSEMRALAANVAHALGLTERQAVKTLIFDTNKDEFVLVMLGGDQNAISGLLKKALGSRNIKLAAPEKVKELTGYVIGSIPPFHWQPDGFRTFIEASLMDESILGVGTGCWGEEILISPENLVKASGAQVVNLTQK